MRYTVRSSRIAFLISLCAATPVTASAAPRTERITCPSRIDAASVNVSIPPPGWSPFIQQSLELNGVGVSYGPPEELADSVPVSDKTHEGKSVVTWELDTRHNESKWVRCTYGSGGEFALKRELARSTSRCVATYSQKPGQTIIDMRCWSEN